MTETDVGATWDRVADGWDRHEQEVAEHTAPIRRRLLESLDPRPGDLVLELAAGTGALSRAIAAAVAPDGSVLCTDIAPRMVEVARRRASEATHDNLRCTVLDAQDTGLPGDSFDGIVYNLGFMLMPDRTAALRESRRILRPTGRLVLSTWGPPERNPWLVLIAGALLTHGHVPQADPLAAGGVFSLGDADGVAAELEAAGFDQVDVELVDILQRFPSFDAYWELHAAIGGPIAAALSGLDDAEIERIRDTCESYCGNFATDGGLALPGQAVVATATSECPPDRP